jgi:hydroxymethylpyrimidine/phosphomethylpyrimidine kinase
MDLFLVELPVADWPASVAWYRDRLGLPVILLDEPNRYALLAAGSARLALKAGPATPDGPMIVFRVPDLDAELVRLAGCGIVPTGAVKASPEGYRVAHFLDPDGHRLAVFEWVVPNRAANGGV